MEIEYKFHCVLLREQVKYKKADLLMKAWVKSELERKLTIHKHVKVQKGITTATNGKVIKIKKVKTTPAYQTLPVTISKPTIVPDNR